MTHQSFQGTLLLKEYNKKILYPIVWIKDDLIVVPPYVRKSLT